MGKSWPLPREWGLVPDVYTGVLSEVEMASPSWLVKLIEDDLRDFRRYHLISRVEAKKAKWRPPSPIQKLKIPLLEILQRKKRKKGFIIGPRPSNARPSNPRQKRATSVAPSLSSLRPDYLSAKRFVGVGAASGIEVKLAFEAYEAWLNARASGGIVLAQPAPSGLTLDPSIGALGPREPSVGSPGVEMLTEQQQPILEPPTVSKESARTEDTT
ncbi:hypothetical protein Nepgr_025881 [Nepenthes gracilis]|uniref:Uncharacterized protein n=1 Tax=Nepenthes gracilis TaxID=150966 RepID=A0AAD3T730_NEPGR|nr:hypothetical protein Nepgr_025881 [Nepenthes gracilis]